MMEDGLVLDVDIIEAELTKKITKRVTDEVTQQVTRQVTDEVTRQVTQQDQIDIIRKLYSKLDDVFKVAELLDIPVNTVKESI